MKKKQHTQPTPDEIMKRDENFHFHFQNSGFGWKRINIHNLFRMKSSKGMKIVDENFHIHSKILGLDEKESTYATYSGWNHQKGWNFWMKFSTFTQNSGSGWKIINRHNQLWMKSSKEMKFVDENVHFHSKFWAWMKHNQRKPTLDEII